MRCGRLNRTAQLPLLRRQGEVTGSDSLPGWEPNTGTDDTDQRDGAEHRAGCIPHGYPCVVRSRAHRDVRRDGDPSGEVGRSDTEGTEVDLVLATRWVGIEASLDGVVTERCQVAEHVHSASTLQRVVSGTTGEGVVVGTTVERVV